MISENRLKKVIENDHVIYMEGSPNKSKNFLTQHEKNMNRYKAEKDETLSAADVDTDYSLKSKLIANRDQIPNPGVFERWDYFKNIFPEQLIQKPGYDLYGGTTIFMFIMCIYIFSFYSEISVNSDNFIPKKADNSDIFNSGMILTLLFIVFIMIFERYANRTDTKCVKNKG